MVRAPFTWAVSFLLAIGSLGSLYFQEPWIKNTGAVMFGSLIVAVNILLSIFIIKRIGIRQKSQGILYRLALLLAFFTKVFNLLILTYLGIMILGFDPYLLVVGALLGLFAHLVYFTSLTRGISSTERID